jgi:hypothetical protein
VLTTATYVDNCRLLFPTEPDITIVTSPTGQYVVSLQPYGGPKILLDACASSPAPDLYDLYTKTQQRVADIVSRMKSSMLTRKNVILTPPSSASNSSASNPSSPTRMGGLPFPRFPVHPRTAYTAGDRYDLQPLAELNTGGGGEDKCCGHESELSEERSRRRKAERRVKELEATLKEVLRQMKSIKEEPEEGDYGDREEHGKLTRDKPLAEKQKDGARHVELSVQWPPSERRRSREAWPQDRRPDKASKEGARGGEATRESSDDDDTKFEMLEYP